MKRILLVLFGMLIQLAASAQDLDSLWTVWKDASKADSIRMKAIRSMAIQLKKSSDVDSAISLLDRQTRFAIKIGDRKTLANTFYTKAVWSWNRDQDTSLHYFDRAKGLYQEIGETKKVSDCLLYLGAIYRGRGDYDKTVDLFTESMVLLEELGDKNGMALTANNIGVIFLDREMDNEAEHWFLRSLELAKEVGDSLRLAGTLVNLGIIEGKKGDHLLEQQYLRQALTIRLGLNDARGTATSLINIGQALKKVNKQDSAVVYFEKALAYCDSSNFKSGKAKTLNVLGGMHFDQGNYAKSLQYSQQALEVAMAYDIVRESKFAANRLYRIYKLQNRNKEALEAFELYTSMKDSLDSESNKKAMIRQEFEYRYEKEALADSLAFAQKEYLMQETSKRQQLGLVAAALGLLLLIALAVAIQMGKRRSEKLLLTVSEQHEELKKEKKRGDGLLLNILPKNIANELIEKEEVKARKHDQVTVLFTDFKGFTELANTTDADQLVDELNTCFSAFDHLTGKFGVEKIKTIGDAYMVAAGFDGDAITGALQVVRFALRIQRFMKKHNEKRVKMGLIPLHMRVGVSTGTVVAGVVGVKKFQYDIWGDTVNTASRMESSGDVGKVNISQTTYELLADTERSRSVGRQFTFEYRGEVEAKGKGRLKMYFVEKG